MKHTLNRKNIESINLFVVIRVVKKLLHNILINNYNDYFVYKKDFKTFKILIKKFINEVEVNPAYFLDPLDAYMMIVVTYLNKYLFDYKKITKCKKIFASILILYIDYFICNKNVLKYMFYLHFKLNKIIWENSPKKEQDLINNKSINICYNIGNIDSNIKIKYENLKTKFKQEYISIKSYEDNFTKIFFIYEKRLNDTIKQYNQNKESNKKICYFLLKINAND